MSLQSLWLGLVGKADVVEFHREKAPDGKTIWRPFPVEYKRGRPKKNNCDKIQLCAQALCIGRIPLNMLSMRLVLELILILFLSVVVFVIRKKTALTFHEDHPVPVVYEQWV